MLEGLKPEPSAKYSASFFIKIHGKRKGNQEVKGYNAQYDPGTQGAIRQPPAGEQSFTDQVSTEYTYCETVIICRAAAF